MRIFWLETITSKDSKRLGFKGLMKRQIVNFGSINIDHVYKVDHFVAPGETLASESLLTGLGGKGANQSVAMANAGAKVIHVGQLGVADLWAKKALTDFGVETSYIKFVAEPSGHAIIQLNKQGENAIIVHGGANQTCLLTDLDKCLRQQSDVAYLVLQNECNDVLGAIDLANGLGIDVVFNPAPMSQDVLELSLSKLSILIVNEVEAQQLWGTRVLIDIKSRLENDCPNINVIITQGAKGSTLLNQHGIQHVPALSVTVQDTTAAGDTYVGFLVAGIANGLPIEVAMKNASAAAAITTTRLGAIDAIPSQKEVKAKIDG